MSSDDSIDILLSTYNGGRYLAEQLDSILSQDLGSWRVLVRDDGSEDDSGSIIRLYAEKYPEKITQVQSHRERLGIVKSYEYLIEASDAPYIAFCDQDDVWHPSKLTEQLLTLRDAEMRYGNSCPILVHTDLRVVDENLKPLSNSFWEFQNIYPDRMESFERLLVQNCVTGCAVMLNRRLVQKALPMSGDVIMHDWWFALVAAAEGVIVNSKTANIDYRQHGANDTGAKEWGWRFIMSSIVKRPSAIRENLQKTRRQAISLSNNVVLGEQGSYVAQRYIDMFDRSWLWRRIEIVRMGFYKSGLIRNIGLFVWI